MAIEDRFTKLDLSQPVTGKVGRVRSTTLSKRRLLATVLPRLPYALCVAAASASHIPNPPAGCHGPPSAQ